MSQFSPPQRLTARFSSAAAEVRRISSLAGAAMLAALNLILNQFTLAVSAFLEVSFAFLSTAVCGFLYGPWLAGMAGVVTDIVGHFLRPNGPFFIGWTLSEFLLGVLYGCWFYQKPVTLGRTFAAVLTATLLINLLLTPLWLHIMYGEVALLSGIRLIKNLIKLPVDTALLYALLRGVAHRGTLGRTAR